MLFPLSDIFPFLRRRRCCHLLLFLFLFRCSFLLFVIENRYRDLKTKLEAASEAAGEVDSGKESTLEEISAIVRRMNDALKERKTMLAPQIKLLREVRKEYQDVDGDYSRKKQTYDKVAVGLEVERQSIEQVSQSMN